MKHFTRREVIELSVLSILGGSLGCQDTPNGQLGADRQTILNALRTAYPQLKNAEAAGQAWLAQLASKPNEADLFRSVFGKTDQPTAALFTAIKQQHQADFQAGRAENIKGWRLSKTEATLYGLLSLTRTTIPQ